MALRDYHIDQSLLDFRNSITVRSGDALSGLSIGNMLRTREMGRRQKPRNYWVLYGPNTQSNFTLSEQANLMNRFLPNKRCVIHSSDVPMIRCLHLPNEKIVTLASDKQLRFYKREGTNYRIIRQHHIPSIHWALFDLAVNSKGDQIASTSSDLNVYFCSINNLEEEFHWDRIEGNYEAPTDNNKAYTSLRYSMDNKYLIAGAKHGYVTVFSTEQKRRLTFEAHQHCVNTIYCCQTTPHLFCTASNDKSCKVWDMRSLDDHVALLEHSDLVTSVDGSSDDKFILTNTINQTIKIWDLRQFSENPVHDIQIEGSEAVPHSGTVSHSAPTTGITSWFIFHRAKFSPRSTGNRYIYGGDIDGNFYIFDSLTTEIVRELGPHGQRIFDSSWHPECNEIICTSISGVTARWYYDQRDEVHH